jgi:hypothetical protein
MDSPARVNPLRFPRTVRHGANEQLVKAGDQPFAPSSVENRRPLVIPWSPRWLTLTCCEEAGVLDDGH